MNSRLSDRNDNREIAHKTAWGFIWNFSAYFLGKLVVLITTSILARLLAKLLWLQSITFRSSRIWA
jgi:hypothetical protein